MRRRFLATSAAGLGLGGLLQALGPLTADEVNLPRGFARMSPDIEPLVRFLEETPREQVIEQTAQRIKAGLSYRELLAALLLAGVRNVQPRPSVGFKFHAVLVVNSAHLASLSGIDEERWLPIFWAIDNFKSSQASDESEGDWTLPAVDESNLPSADAAEAMLRKALDDWDEAAADVAITAAARSFGANRIFDLLAEYAARDFRSIGHKVIYLSNAFRTLQTIGWEYAEPVLRSLVYAMLNHEGDPNPALADLPADRPGRFNAQRAGQLANVWPITSVDDGASVAICQTLRQESADAASAQVAELLQRGVALRSVWDGLFASAGELLMRQPGIVALHAVTTTNAIAHAFDATSNERTRRYLLLQNASFLTLFREAARERGELRDVRIDDVETFAQSQPVAEVTEAFEAMGQSRLQAAQQLHAFLAAGGNPQDVADHARRLVFLKGDDSHDYKFSSAALEDYRRLSPTWRNRFLAASMMQLCGPQQPTRPLVERINAALT